jgi:rubrerythrin
LPEVPERRPSEKQQRAYGSTNEKKPVEVPTEKATSPPQPQTQKPAEVKKKLWYCKQCGYVVYREDPPYICPICKAKREMFAEIDVKINFNG